MANLRASDIVASTGEPAFATDSSGTIIGWNEPAERLLGHPAASARGQSCYDLLRGKDEFGNVYCNPDCPLIIMAQQRQSVCRTRMRLQNSWGQYLLVTVSTLVISSDDTSEPTIIHLINPSDSVPEAESPHPRATDAGQSSPRPETALTKRETEVLTLLAQGFTTRQIAGSLYVSPITVRNHIQNIFRKLEVQNRLAAVYAARRQGLI